MMSKASSKKQITIPVSVLRGQPRSSSAPSTSRSIAALDEIAEVERIIRESR
jgi:hypothetical protein